MKIGINGDILAELNGTITPQELGRALRYYVSNQHYQLAMRSGTPRIDLQGNEVGNVTDEQANGAWATLRHREAKTARGKADQAAKQAAEARKNAPKRLSLADLRAAALARKNAAPL